MPKALGILHKAARINLPGMEPWYRKRMEREFWARVTKRPFGGCWIWRHGASYGQVQIKGVLFRAHRLSYLLHHGSIEDGAVIRHTCGNAACVNPKHLISGTQKDNMRDRSIHGRHGGAKVTPDIVRELRRLYSEGRSQVRLGEQFGISQSTVGQIVRGVTWTHVS